MRRRHRLPRPETFRHQDGTNTGAVRFWRFGAYRDSNRQALELSDFVFTRSAEHRRLAKELGADWTGTSEDEPPQKVDCAIDFTPVGETVPFALSVLEKGGKLVIAVIGKSSLIPAMDYARYLWDEKDIKSVANLTRKDAEEFLTLAAKIPIVSEVQEFNLSQANEALLLLDQGKVRGAAVLRI